MKVQQTIEIEGMGCEHCVTAVREALESLSGVTVESVEIGKAVVTREDGQNDSAAFVQAVEEAGYTVSNN